MIGIDVKPVSSMDGSDNETVDGNATSAINALCDAALDPLFWIAERRGEASAWWGHVPFAHWLVCTAQPQTIVELGTHTGVSYAAFCQAVLRGGLPTRCFAIDTWKGDEHTGFYGEEVFQQFRQFHDEHYASFSTLLRCTFDEALAFFPNKSIDLLHIDGLHTYEAVHHDFTSWFDKLSHKAIVLFHDINERQNNFGVWRLWSELCDRFPCFEFTHSYGLGVLAVGPEAPTRVLALCAADQRKKSTIRYRFAQLGERWIIDWRERERAVRVADLARRASEYEAALAQSTNEAAGLKSQVAELEVALTRSTSEAAELRSRVAELEVALALNTDEASAKSHEIRQLEEMLHEARVEIEACEARAREIKHAGNGGGSTLAENRRLRDELDRLRAEVNRITLERDAVLNSTLWQATSPIRRIGARLPLKARQYAHDAARLGLWTATEQLGRNLREARRRSTSGTPTSLLRGRAPVPAADPIRPLFDEALYLSLNPDIARAVQEGAIRSAYDHFQEHGRYDSWRPLRFHVNELQFDFDETAYLADNPDVVAMIARGDYRDGFDQFVRIGHKQCEQGMRAIYGPHRFVRLLREESGNLPRRSKNYLALFAHYDRDNLIDDYVLHYLDALYAAGIDICTITAVSDAAQLEKLRTRSFKILIKNDAGRDFGSWYIALKTLGTEILTGYDYVLFVNDSIYFPVADPDPFFSTMTRLNLNMWGMHDSRDLNQYHIQSFFLAFDRLARDIVLPEFIRQYELTPYMTKAGQIRTFELGLTRWAMEAGLSVGAFCPIDDVREEIIQSPDLAQWRPLVQNSFESTNPTHDLWSVVITRYGAPGLKIELLRDNPKHLPIEGWRKQIDNRFIDPEMIQKHLDRIINEPQHPGLSAKPIPARPVGVEFCTREIIEGRGFDNKQRLVLLAHYDPHDIIDDYVVNAVRVLHKSDSDVVLITSTDKAVEIGRVRPLCAAILLKPNVGRDFGSWYLACQAYQTRFSQYESVIWMNDSTYFPLFDPSEMFSTMDRRKLDFWGVVDSHLITWHVMSWFWAFSRKVNESGWIDWYLREFNPTFTKWDQIRNFEMRMPMLLSSRGYAIGSYISANEVFSYTVSHVPNQRGFSGRRDFNMAHECWDIIIQKFRCPSLKVELLRDNPLGIDIENALEFIRDNTQYDTELIRRHIRRIKTAHLAQLSGSEQPQYKLDAIESTRLLNHHLPAIV